MHILIAPDSFKDSLSALEVANALKEGICAKRKDIDISLIPMADGGEGTVQSLVDATGGKIISVDVHDPLMRKVKSFFGILGDETTAVIEMAAASGIELLKPDERNPWLTSTYGTGELIKLAIDKGCRKIILGIGGSATNDGGIGMASALGYVFLDHYMNPVNPTGGEIAHIVDIDYTNVLPEIKDCEFIVACDVTNPLTGSNGASFVYGPQKGADESMVKKLDANLEHLAALIKNKQNTNIIDIPGSGAAGGLGGGLVAFTGATLQKGFDIISNICNLESAVKEADIVITGEGKMDFQTQYGKTPYGVAQIAKKYNKPVIGIAGSLGDNYTDLLEKGFTAIFSIVDSPMNLDFAIKNAKNLLINCGLNISGILDKMR